MNQALAYAELLIGGILFLMGYKGASLSEVVQGKGYGATGMGPRTFLPEKINPKTGKAEGKSTWEEVEEGFETAGGIAEGLGTFVAPAQHGRAAGPKNIPPAKGNQTVRGTWA